ncbi:TonB-dependent receptor [Massilia sp. TW-1]|uniref:TonB-dependent receptor n=1 Tax=Telluria antibiotica TaxID=2717319 RepID=A0ABX0PFW7_9BURK|nr:outer membrane beta-barrel protein [Telluria antibiotica]NIA56161.1 TonB-dependent receptor [Telluria antibiotica]
MTSTTSAARRAIPDTCALRVLPALLLTCFTIPLHAQTAAPEPVRTKPAAPTSKTTEGAQATKAPASGGDDGVATVEVVATRPTNKVDRDVYDLKNDISVSNASAADILNNVPSVTVDQDGNVALRGNQNVQIMVNGKRDAQFQGQNRGDVLNAFPAESIESVEVINVPGAEFGNEGGSGPIINLVLKRNRKAGSRATLSANKGTQGRGNAFLNGEHAEGPYSISGNLGVAERVREGYSESQREDLDPATGAVTGAQHAVNNRQITSKSLNMASTFTYNVGDRDQAGATVSYSKIRNESDATGATQRYAADMAPLADYTTRSRNVSPAENFGIGASYDHKSGLPGEDLKFDLRYTGQNNHTDSSVDYDYRLQPTPFTANSLRRADRRNRILDVSVDYERNVWDTWHLKAGAKVADSRNENPTGYLAQDPVTGDYVPVPSRISDFESNDRNAAIYGILSTKLAENLNVQGGLRGEYTTLDVRQPLLQEEDKYRYVNWLPSFYVTRDIGANGMLQLRMSRRIARPNERDLNPNLVYLSDFNARQGNPHLQPVNNDNFEVAYRDRLFGVDSSFVLFKRRESPVVGNRSYALASDPNVIVTSPINFGANDAVGVDLNFNVRQLFLSGLSANLGATIGNEKRQRIANFATDMTGVQQSNHRENIKLRLAYQAGKEALQLSVNRTGASLNGQGVNSAVTMTSFTWRHNFDARLSLNVNVANVFHTGTMESDVENEVLRLHSLTTGQPRVVQIGLRYHWGGVTGDDRIRNGGRGNFRGGPEGRGGESGYGNGGLGNGGFGNGGGRGF